MPQLDGKGPFDDGSIKGRRIGYCNNNPNGLEDIVGKGLGLRKHSPYPGKGQGKRNKYNLSNN